MFRDERGNGLTVRGAHAAARTTRPIVRLPSRPTILRLLITALAAAAVGSQMRRLPAAEPRAYLVAAPAVIALGFVASRGLRYCIVGYIAVALLGPSEPVTTLGPLDLRYTDFIYVVLLAWVVVVIGRGDDVAGRPIGQRWIMLFLAVLGLTVFDVALTASDDLERSLVAWLRLVLTLSLVLIVPYAVRHRLDRRLLLGGVLASLSLLVADAVVRDGIEHGLAVRVRGTHGPNSTGLFAALLVVAAIHSPVPARRGLRLTMGAIGLAGLAGTRSIGSIVAVGVVLGLHGVSRSEAMRLRRRPGALGPIRIVFAALAVFAVVSLLRPTNLPASEGFYRSSTAARLIAADAGVEIFKENPVFGVGWQRSSLSSVAGSPELNDRLRERWPEANPEFFPDVQQGSVHSGYVQVLAESGIIGSVVFAGMFLAVRRRVWGVVADAVPDGGDRLLARVLVLWLVALAVWWNDNPFYGAQPESALLAVILGLLASYRAERSSS